MRVVLFLFLMIFIVSCEPPQIADNPDLPNKGTLATQVTNQAFVQLKLEKDLYPFGTGSRMMGQIKMLALAFHYYKEIGIEEARELLMAAATKFLSIINSNEQIRPYLDNYPFKPENIQIRIFIKKPDGSKFAPDKLSVVTMVNGLLEYEINQTEKYKLLTIYDETFDEAQSKLNNNAILKSGEQA